MTAASCGGDVQAIEPAQSPSSGYAISENHRHQALFACRGSGMRVCHAAMQINYQKAKAICTEAEFNILASAKPVLLAAMKLGELRALAPKARKYSDKWLAQSRKQGNSSDGAGARSFAKHEFFKEALARVEARIEKLTLVKPAPDKPAKKTTKKTAKKAVATKKAAKKAVKVAKKAASTRARSAMSLATQAKKKSIGTGLRMAASGKNSRVRGHVSAQGRRNQAARSARKR